jgi:hypothetical protein
MDRSKILRIAGFTLIGAAPFVVSYLLLPSDALTELRPEPSDPGPAPTLEFPFAATPAPSFSPSAPEPPTSPIKAAPSASPLRQCSNARDDDGDGRIDRADPGCSSGNDNSEAPNPVLPSPAATSPAPPESSDPSPLPSPLPPPPPNCSDGADNDGDGLPDGADPGCDDGNELPINDTGPSPASGENDLQFPEPVVP